MVGERREINRMGRRETFGPVWLLLHVLGAEGRQYFTGV